MVHPQSPLGAALPKNLPKILSTIYPSADLPSLIITHPNSKVDKIRANIALEPVPLTFTLVTKTTTSLFSFCASIHCHILRRINLAFAMTNY